MELIWAVTGEREFFNTNHLLALREERRDGQKKRDGANDATLNGLVGDLLGTKQSLTLRTKNTGAWLSVPGTTVPGTVFSDT